MSRALLEDIKEFFITGKPNTVLFYFGAGGNSYAGISDIEKCFFRIPLNGEKKDFHATFTSVTLFAKEGTNGYELIFNWEGERNNVSDLFISMALTEFFPEEKRNILYNEPEIFAEQLKEAFGNSNVSDPVAEKIAELYVYYKLLENGMQPKFGGFSNKSSIDIECAAFDIEVKSTTRHHDWIFSSRPEQLRVNAGNRPLYLTFCRLEPTEIAENNWSIQKLVDLLSARGISGIENLPKDTSDRKRLYKIRDTKVIEITENFPCPKLPDSTIGASLVSFELQILPDELDAISLDEFIQRHKN